MYQKMKTRLKYLEKQIQKIEKKISRLPEGYFFITKSRKYYKWYYKVGNEQLYIPKSERKLAEKLAAKRYLSTELEDLKQEKLATQYYLRHGIAGTKKSDQLLIKCPEYLNLISNIFKPQSLELKEWLEEPFEQSQEYPEHLIYKTPSGNVVRSKSEVLIDSALLHRKIPFRYEAKLKVGNSTYYPDFTIKHPKTGETIYWEHLGRVDDPEYQKKNFLKIQNYIQYGIVPFHNLILTFETKECPLDIGLVEHLIEYYFL